MQKNEFVVCSGQTKLNEPLLEEQINQSIVEILDGRWKSLNMKQLCPSVQQWRVQELSLQNNDHPTLLKQVHHIMFPNLRLLNLNNNSIYSIQGLNRLQLPLLNTLVMCDNNITVVEQFRKWNYRNIGYLGISNNKINNGQQIVNMHGTNEIKGLSLQYDWSSLQINNLNWICKLNLPSIKSLRIKNKGRIRQKKLYQTIKNKYKEICILSKQ